MRKATPILTLARGFTNTEEGRRAKKITALRSAYKDGDLRVDDTEVARRLLEAALRIDKRSQTLVPGAEA